MNEERPIEKLLHRFAKKRRDEAGAPAELHPANRRLLQAEVARQFPKALRREGGWAGLSLLLNRKLAYAVALVAVVGVASLLILPAGKKEDPASLLALDSKQKATLPEPGNASLPAVVAESARESQKLETKETMASGEIAAAPAESLNLRNEPLSLAERSKSVSLGGEPERDRVATRRAQVTDSIASFNERETGSSGSRLDSPLKFSGDVTTSARTEPQPSLALSSIAVTNAPDAEMFSHRYGTPRTLATSPAAGAARSAPMAKTVAAPGAGGKLDDGSNVTQAYTAIMTDNYAFADKKQATQPVLVNFVVEQNGPQIRVTDSDGSTYSGLVQLVVDESPSAKQFIARGGGLEKAPAARPAPSRNQNRQPPAPAQSLPNTFFRVSGTNRTLNQAVNFSGNFVTLGNQLTNAQFQIVDQAKDENLRSIPPLQNSTIRGRLQIGTGREIEVNAVPVSK